jgi:hypothetical protein
MSMHSVLDNFSSPAWWISVVIVSILTSIIAAYMKPLLDRGGSRFSARWRDRIAQNAAARSHAIELLRGSSHEQVMLAFAEIRARLSTLYLFLFSFGFATFLTLFQVLSVEFRLPPSASKALLTGGAFVGLITTLAAGWALREAFTRENLLREARRDDPKVPKASV